MSEVVEFIQLVEKYPCLYNNEVPEYGRKDTTEKAWQEVANELEWTISECKDKWKNIRNGYVRSLKPSPNGQPKKPYYLTEALQFVLPYINPITNIQVEKKTRSTEDYEDQSEDEKEDMEIEVSPIAHKTRQKKPLDVDTALASWLRNKKPKKMDHRKMFLLSLLPDVKGLTEEQLGVFRIKALILLEEVKAQSGKGLQALLSKNT